MNTNPLQKAVKAAMFTGAALAVALPAAYAADADDSLEEVVVTGSRIKRDGFDSVSPVTVTSAEDIKVAGYTRIEDVLNTLPQVEQAQVSTISNGSTGTASLDLRGLGSSRTLVLVNGRRLHYGNLNTFSPDINQIPSAMVERVEVLTGGASATYGADAVAGVVNFVMKNDFEGVEINVGASAYQHDNDNQFFAPLLDARGFDYPTGSSGLDGKAYNVDVSMGSEFADGNGHAVVYATYRKNDELLSGARDYASCALNTAGTSCGGSLNAIIPNFFIGDIDPVSGVQDSYALWSLDSGSNFIPFDGTNRYNYAPVNHFQRPDKRYSLGAFVDYELNESFNPYMEVMYTSDVTRAQIAESGTFFVEQYNLPLTSSLLNDAQRAQLVAAFPGINNAASPYDGLFSVYVGKRNVEGGPRTDILETDSARIVLGSTGALTETWDYDVSYSHAETASNSTYINDFFAPSIATALEEGTYNVFQFGGVTSEQAAGLSGTGIINGSVEQDIFNAYATGDLGFSVNGQSNIAAVFGIETREESFESISDSIFSEGSLLGQGGATPSIGGTLKAKEAFTELNIPLLEGDQKLSMDLAYRVSDYDAAGSLAASGVTSSFDNSTYKVGFEWQPIDMLRVRAGYNKAERVPNVANLFTAQNLGLWQGTDPCAGAAPTASAAACANTGVSAAQYGNISPNPAGQYNAVFGGNPDLQPEKADTYTIGAVVDPIDNLTVSLDYWNIEMEDVISSGVPQQTVLSQCLADAGSPLCGLITRAPSGSLWRGTAGFIQSTNANLAGRKFAGLDLASSYSHDAFGGTFDHSLNGTFMMDKEFNPVPGDATADYECVGDINVNCFAQPEWRHIYSASYDRGGPWAVNARWRYFGKVSDQTSAAPADTLAGAGIDAQSYIDISGTYDVNENISVLFGMNNVADKEPPAVGGTLNSNANVANGNYDALGRYLYGSITSKY